MSNKDELPPMTDYMRNLLRDHYTVENVESFRIENEVVIIVDSELCNEIKDIKMKLNALIERLGREPLTDAEFDILFLTIMDIDPNDIT